MMVDWGEERTKIIGLGENSFKKSYYPELQKKIDELEISAHHLQTILNSMSDAIIIHDYSGKMLYVNKQGCEIFNIQEDEVSKHTIADIYIKESNVDSLVDIWNEVGSNHGKTFEWIAMQIGTNLEFPVNVSLNSINWNGSAALIAVIRDFTEQKQAQLLLAERAVEIESQNVQLKELNCQLLSAKEKAEESDRLKSAFLANMSHEIRTPMNGILGFSNLLKDPNISMEERMEDVEMIEKSGVRLLNIINDLIDISKIEAGMVEVNNSRTNIDEQIDFVYNFFKPEADKKGIRLSFKKTLPANEGVIFSDQEKIYAILINLVKNAIKYTEQGVIEFGYNINGGFLEYFVKDTGMGIPKDRQAEIFKRFIQADISDKQAMQGAGLGLSIAQAYVEMLGGDLWVESEEGKGSVFCFTIPYTQFKGENEIVVNSKSDCLVDQDIANLKVLIVEDEDVVSKFLAISLKRISREILFANTGKEALDLCLVYPDIDLILMDIKMPEMDGLEATCEIRKFNKEVVIIAQTAFALVGDKEKILKAGCNDYISKPINKEALLGMIQKHCTCK